MAAWRTYLSTCIFYLIAGVFAGLLSVVLSGYFGFGIGESIFGAADVPMVGASGAIFGLAGLFMILVPTMKFTFLLFPFFSFPAYIIIPAVLFLTWVGTATAAIIFHKAILLGNVAHFGGLIVGVVYGVYLRRKD